MNNIIPADCNIKPHEKVLANIVDELNKGLYLYEYKKPDPRLMELFVIGNNYSFEMFVRFVKDSDNTNQIRDNYYQVLIGHGFLSTLKHYIIDNNPIEDLEVLTELNDKRFDAWPPMYQRKVRERTIKIYEDWSFPYTDNDYFSKTYLDVFNNML